MLLHELLVGKRLVLASNSPRRKELLKGLDVNFEIWRTNHKSETYPSSIPQSQIPEYLAEQKAIPFHSKIDDNIILITCDTIVICGNTVIGKPTDKTDAHKILQMLSGAKHTVITGICITSKNKTSTFKSLTDVFFKKLSNSEIDYYIEKYLPLDKAGAYGIQEWIGFVGVERIDGSYFNVMGLPVQQLNTELVNFLSK